MGTLSDSKGLRSKSLPQNKISYEEVRKAKRAPIITGSVSQAGIQPE